MRIRNLSGKVTLFFAVLAALTIPVFGQKLPEPKQEKLLNGLKLLMWPDDKADKVWVRIRVHSGSAFDPQGKEGVMKLLADSFFPNETARDFFAEDLGGSLEVESNYDYIQVNASSKPDQFLSMLETLAAGVTNPTIDKETTAKLRNALLAKVATMEADTAYVADQAIAKRLFGSFPYGRPQLGSSESLKRIDFADLIDAKQRFLTADNATMAISGNFDRAVAYRAARRYFGSWLKADKTIPSTFRQPDDPSVALMSLPSAKGSATRLAFRGVARSDKDLAPSLVFTKVLQSRLRSRAADASVENRYNGLPGSVIITLPATLGSKEGRDVVIRSMADPISDAEFQAALGSARSDWSQRDAATFWLDADTYKLADAGADAHIFDKITLADVTAYALRARSLPLVSILISVQPS
jgi:Insulinase (Peptidase family M16)/Peptidase M16 inactive domain